MPKHPTAAGRRQRGRGQRKKASPPLCASPPPLPFPLPWLTHPTHPIPTASGEPEWVRVFVEAAPRLARLWRISLANAEEIIWRVLHRRLVVVRDCYRIVTNELPATLTENSLYSLQFWTAECQWADLLAACHKVATSGEDVSRLLPAGVASASSEEAATSSKSEQQHGDQAEKASPDSIPETRRRGPPPTKSLAAKDRMLKELKEGRISREELRDTKKESLALKYKCKPTTALKARELALAEFAAKTATSSNKL
jgi:hypothetical protein